MKTSPTEHRRLPYHGSELIIICVCILLAVLLLVYLAIGFYNVRHLTYHFEDEVQETFSKNQSDFDALAELLLEKDELFQYLYDERDSHSIPDLRSLDRKNHPCREFFSDEEWDFLCRFVDVYKPDEIYRRNGLAIMIYFRVSNGSVTLCYIPRDGQGKYLEEIHSIKLDSFTDQFLDLGDDWYLRVSSRS